MRGNLKETQYMILILLFGKVRKIINGLLKTINIIGIIIHYFI